MISDFQNKIESQALAAETKGKPARLVAIAGINERNFVKVAARGAFTSPSIAITKTDKNYNQFGNIQILFKASVLFDGETGVGNRNNESIVATGDYYSVRTPDLKMQLYAPAMKELKELALEHGEDDFYNKIANWRSGISFDRVFDFLERQSSSKRIFLMQSGLEVKNAYKRKPFQNDSITAFALERMKVSEFSDLLNGVLAEKEGFGDRLNALVRELYEEKYSGAIDRGVYMAEERMESAIERRLENGAVYCAKNVLNELEEYRSRKMVIDTKRTSERIERAFRKAGGHAAFNLWIARLVDSLKCGYYSVTEDGKKLKDWEAVDRYMKSNRGECQEAPSSFGVGELRAMKTERLYSLQEVIECSGNIATDEKVYDSEELSKALHDYRGKLDSLSVAEYSFASDSTEVERRSIEALTSAGLGQRFDDVVIDNMKRQKISLTDENIKAMTEVSRALLQAYTDDHSRVPYFEAKEMRSIPLMPDRYSYSTSKKMYGVSESIEAILVTKENKDFVEGILMDYGIKGVKVKTYNPQIEGSMYRGMSDEADIVKHSHKLERYQKQEAKKVAAMKKNSLSNR
ncbi:hypothetical protein [Vibrio sp. D431a]|uniref:hypothetical protein n=1 Tax=Vibrio sp. D431a TaxID=2837388 RepID=UPI002554644D|nr:hypothetical protein [Vibrio sp. D431a]MDK9790106.1 hypothetical protein [Vibrio sp. D431a]